MILSIQQPELQLDPSQAGSEASSARLQPYLWKGMLQNTRCIKSQCAIVAFAYLDIVLSIYHNHQYGSPTKQAVMQKSPKSDDSSHPTTRASA